MYQPLPIPTTFQLATRVLSAMISAHSRLRNFGVQYDAARLPHCAQWLRAIFPESLLQVLVGIVKEEPDDRFGNFRPLGIKDEHLIVELVHQLNLY